MRSVDRALRRASTAVLLAALIIVASPSAEAGAQYGGISGLFVITSPTDPGVADFNGLGCAGGEEVALYMPGITPTPSDPPAANAVPGRVLAVTTSVVSADALFDGTFVFDDVILPTDLSAGIYEVHSRCGALDLVVFVELSPSGVVVIQPTDPGDPVLDDVRNPTGSLPFTGRSSNRMASYGALLAGLGVVFLAAGRSRQRHPT